MQHRYRFFSSPTSSANLWQIEGDEYFHARKVLRLGVGSEVEVFDACGSWGEGHISEIGKAHLLVQVTNLQKETPHSTRIALAFGALQQQTMAELIPCLVELGIDEFHIFHQENQPKARLNDKLSEKWHKIALSSLKQCKRSYLPTFKIWGSLAKFLENTRGNFATELLLEPTASSSLSRFKFGGAQSLCLLMGSEKGFSELEMALLKDSTFKPVSMGTAILRSFTAAIAASALVSIQRDESQSN